MKKFLKQFWWLILLIILLIFLAFAICGILHNKELKEERNIKKITEEEEVVKPSTIAVIHLPLLKEMAGVLNMMVWNQLIQN